MQDETMMDFSQILRADGNAGLSHLPGNADYLQEFNNLDLFHDELLSQAFLDPLGGDNFNAFNISGAGSNSLLGNNAFWGYPVSRVNAVCQGQS